MKNKKIWARIGAIFACVLLVGALAIPAFADDIVNPNSGADEFYPSYELMFDWFYYSLSPQSQNLATQTLLDWYFNDIGTNVNSLGIFGFDTFVAGRITSLPYYSGKFQEFYLPIDDDNNNTLAFEMQERIAVDRFEVYVDDYVEDTLYNVSGGSSSYVTVDYQQSADGSGTIKLVFEDSERIEFLFDTMLNDSHQVTYVLTDVIVHNSVDYRNIFATDILDISYAFIPVDNQSTALLSMIRTMLNASSIDAYGENTYNPRNFYYALENSYDWLYDQAYDDAYTDGYYKGVEDGRNEVINEFEGNTDFEKGYNAAVREIEDGDFGRNLLGGIFSAPIDALREFTLVEWVTESGVEVSIDLLTVFSAFVGVSLFVWFLKLFAGG